MKNTILVFIAIFFAISTQAQTPEQKWGVGVNLGLQQYAGDFGGGFYNFNQALYGFGGISIARNLSEHFDVELNASYGEVGYVESGANQFRHGLFQFNVNAKYNFFKYEDVKFRPFVFAGLGYMHFSDKKSDREVDNMQLPDFGAVASNFNILDKDKSTGIDLAELGGLLALLKK